VAGWKPTPDLVPTTGLVHLSDRLDTVGPIARTTEDLHLMAEVLASIEFVSEFDLNHCTFGVPATFLDQADDDVTAAFAGAVARNGLGTHSVEMGFDPAVIRRAGLLHVEAGGYDTHRDVLEQRPDAWSNEIRELLTYADRERPPESWPRPIGGSMQREAQAPRCSPTSIAAATH